tara:strand:+ start:209 stop:400 length:192 start_codon:yes stop_codon:yes gene_type:complete
MVATDNQAAKLITFPLGDAGLFPLGFIESYLLARTVSTEMNCRYDAYPRQPATRTQHFVKYGF